MHMHTVVLCGRAVGERLHGNQTAKKPPYVRCCFVKAVTC